MTEARTSTGGGAAKLPDLLLALARAESRADVLALLRRGVRELAGAGDCVLLSVAAESGPVGTGGEAGEVVAIDRDGRLGRALAAGQVLDLPASDAEIRALPLAAEAEAVRLLPCAGPGSTLAVCVAWRDRAAGGDDLLALAAAAGMAVARLDAIDRERRGRSELQSRIRNVVATIRSVSTRSADRAESLEDYIMHFEGRLDAMARPHVAFARSGSGRLDLEDLLRAELLAEGIQEGPRCVLQGMPIAVMRGTAEVLGLALHELAVNCVKFGPLSGRGGTLSVRWWSETGPQSVRHFLQWREACDLPAPLGPYRIGFGRHILERALPYETGTDTDLAIGPYALSCTLAVPDPDLPST